MRPSKNLSRTQTCLLLPLDIRGRWATCLARLARQVVCHETRVHLEQVKRHGSGPTELEGKAAPLARVRLGRSSVPHSLKRHASTHRRVRSCALARGTGALQGCPLAPPTETSRAGWPAPEILGKSAGNPRGIAPIFDPIFLGDWAPIDQSPLRPHSPLRSHKHGWHKLEGPSAAGDRPSA